MQAFFFVLSADLSTYIKYIQKLFYLIVKFVNEFK